MEFSKKILIVASIINIAVIIFTAIMVAITLDLSVLSYLIPSVAAEVATGTGFYYSKAKAENKIKLMKENNIKPEREDFIMSKIDWKRKLSSRKLWAAIGGAVASLGTAFGMSDDMITRASGIIAAVGLLAFYIFTEGKIDAASVSSNTTETEIIVEEGKEDE